MTFHLPDYTPYAIDLIILGTCVFVAWLVFG